MNSIRKKFKNTFLYNGLEKEEYQVVANSLDAHNKAMLNLFAGASLLLFVSAVIISYTFHILRYNRWLYHVAVILSLALKACSEFTDYKNKKIYTYLSVVWIILFEAISFGMAVSPTGINEKTTLFLVFPLIGPMFFCIPGGLFSFVTISYEILYIVIYTWLGSNTPYYKLNIVNTVVCTIVALFAGNTTMNVMARSSYELIKNQETDELEKLNNSLKQQFRIIKSIATMFHLVYYVDLEDDVIFEVSHSETLGTSETREKTAMELLDLLCSSHIEEKYVERVRRFVDADFVKNALRDKDSVSEEFIGKTLGWCRVVCIPVERREGEVVKVLLCFERIHEQKKREFLAQERLRDALEEAKKADKAKSSFLFNMSHDIRTPMNAILGYANLLEKSENLDEVQSRYVSGILSSGDQLLGLINNVLETARIESGRMELNEEVLRCSDSSKAIMDVFGPMAESKNLDLSVNIDVKHEYLYADTVKVNEVMFNLVSNAIKYTEKGSIKISITEEEVDKNHSNYIFVVEDTGIGMSEEFLPHIFESFTRENTVVGSKILGTGLGLEITKKLMNLMGGTIDVKSTLGKGTTFRCSLPNRLATKEEFEQKQEKKSEFESINFNGMRILLAEDNDLNADIAIEILKEYNINVDWAKDGKRCVDMLLDKEPGYYDAILMDVQMPVMNGHEATKAIRQLKDDERSNTVIIAMTANAFEEDKQKCLESGMNGFVSKPIEINKLMETLAEIVK